MDLERLIQNALVKKYYRMDNWQTPIRVFLQRFKDKDHKQLMRFRKSAEKLRATSVIDLIENHIANIDEKAAQRTPRFRMGRQKRTKDLEQDVPIVAIRSGT